MKKKIIVSLIAMAALVGAVIFQVLPAGAATPGVLASVTITPPSATVSTGGTVQFVAQGYDDGTPILALSDVTYSWSVAPATGAGTVNATTGLYTTGTTAGTATVQVTATQGTITKTKTATVTVTAAATPGVLANVTVTPPTATVFTSGTVQFAAQGFGDGNLVLNDVTYSWIVEPATGAGTVTATGLYTAAATAGTAKVKVTATQGAITKTATANITVTAATTPGVLANVTVTPPTATVFTSGTVQFAAQGFGDGNLVLNDVTYSWIVEPATGAGTITATGLYTAAATAGTAKVKVTATQGAIAKTATANITVTSAALPVPVANVDAGKLSKLLNGYLNAVGFENFLGGQWQVKNGTATDTIKATAGVVQAVTPTGLTVLANGQTTATTLTLTPTTAILPKGAQLAATDKVAVITVNDQLTVVIKIVAPSKTGGDVPPGWKNKEGKGSDGKTPPGWSQGKKTGWGKDRGEHGEDNERD